MIIGISGKLGSGKDTVAKIIQYLTSEENRKATGYDISFEDFCDKAWNEEMLSGWKVKKFAGKLKQVASLLTGVPIEKWEDQEFKKQVMPNDWGMTYREFLQKLGTDAMRDGLHTDVWVNALFADYTLKSSFELDPIWDGTKPDRYPNWLVTDVRFPNEAKAIKDRGGIMLRIEGPIRQGGGFTRRIYPEGGEHPSETALDNYKFDYRIQNDGTIEELEEKVKQFLIQFKLN